MQRMCLQYLAERHITPVMRWQATTSEENGAIPQGKQAEKVINNAHIALEGIAAAHRTAEGLQWAPRSALYVTPTRTPNNDAIVMDVHTCMYTPML